MGPTKNPLRTVHQDRPYRTSMQGELELTNDLIPTDSYVQVTITCTHSNYPLIADAPCAC